MTAILRRLYFRMYIRWLALQWVRRINVGDAVWHNGRIRVVSNGAHDGFWTLTDPWEEFIPRSECRKVVSFQNFLWGYRSGVQFYTTAWLDIWVRDGIQPWVRALRIWP